MKAVIQSQFSCCPLIWMFHSRKLNNRINRIHERSLRIVYRDVHSTFYELLRKHKSLTIHERNIQLLAIELYKVKNGLAPEFMYQVFPMNENKDYCSKKDFLTRKVNSVYNGTETLSHLGPKLWLMIPNEIKALPSLTLFKAQIKTWKPDKCPCRLCKPYICNVLFIG